MFFVLYYVAFFSFYFSTKPNEYKQMPPRLWKQQQLKCSDGKVQAQWSLSSPAAAPTRLHNSTDKMQTNWTKRNETKLKKTDIAVMVCCNTMFSSFWNQIKGILCGGDCVSTVNRQLLSLFFRLFLDSSLLNYELNFSVIGIRLKSHNLIPGWNIN